MYYKFLVFVGLIFTSQLAIAETPKVRNSAQGIPYITAGIGEEEVAMMKRQAKNFTLNLLFSEGVVGRWATDINVNIYDEASNLMFRVVGAQPVLYVNLPAGTYTILANNNGNKLRQKITLESSANKKVVLNWKDFVDEDMPLDAEGN
ncbi:MAG: hypothetical protein ABL880_00960 [Methylotenera sp.]